jgi:hypothetical protein
MNEQEHSLIGDDGEFIDPDTHVDPHEYEVYVASLPKPIAPQLDSWDESRVIAWLETDASSHLHLLFCLTFSRLCIFSHADEQNCKRPISLLVGQVTRIGMFSLHPAL